MNNPVSNPGVARRVRIASHVTQSRFLHIEDSLQIGKLRLFAGAYSKGSGMRQFANAYLDIADARVLFSALARGEEGFSYKEYKGTPTRNGQPTVSRVLTATVKGEQVYIELKTGPGKLTPTGAVTPAGAAKVEVNVAFKRHEAQRLATEVLAYLQAWDVVRMLGQRQVVGLLPYTLVTVEEMRSAERGMRNEEEVRNEEEMRNAERGVRNEAAPLRTPHSALHTSSRPVTRKGKGNGAGKVNGAARGTNGPAAANGAGRSAAPPPPPPPTLVYGDGSQVDASNVTEVQTFELYQAEKRAVPASKGALLAFYQQRAAAR